MANYGDIFAQESWEALSADGGFSFGRLELIEDGSDSLAVHSITTPVGGFMVGGIVPELVIPMDEGLVRAATAYFAERYRTHIENDGYFVGAWVNEETGMVHIDVSERVEWLSTALELAMTRGELAVWDNAMAAEIKTPQPVTV